MTDAGHTLIPYGTDYDPTQIQGIVIRSQVQADSTFLAQYPSLQHIYRVGVGIEHIDQTYCTQHQITIHNTP